jgi:hypothetical protein
LRAGALGVLPLTIDHVGSAWNSRAQVDVVGINMMEKTLVLGECKWMLSKIDHKVMTELVEEKATKIIPADGKWKVYFLGFSRSGWTSGAQIYQNEINRQPVRGENWVSTGMRLVNLDELDDSLVQWTK